jgi:hypothetical protein
VEDKKGCSQLSLHFFLYQGKQKIVLKDKERMFATYFRFFVLNSLRKTNMWNTQNDVFCNFHVPFFLTCYGNNLGEDMNEGNLQLSLLLVGRNEMRQKHVEHI